jgi:hypothetical protein
MSRPWIGGTQSRPWSSGGSGTGSGGGTRSRPLLRISDAETRKENVEVKSTTSESATSSQRNVDSSRLKPVGGTPAPGRITRSTGSPALSSSGKSANVSLLLKCFLLWNELINKN